MTNSEPFRLTISRQFSKKLFCKFYLPAWRVGLLAFRADEEQFLLLDRRSRIQNRARKTRALIGRASHLHTFAVSRYRVKSEGPNRRFPQFVSASTSFSPRRSLDRRCQISCKIIQTGIRY